MTRSGMGSGWLRFRFRAVPQEHRESFLTETAIDNLGRLRYACLVLLALTGLLLFRPGIFGIESADITGRHIIYNYLFAGVALALFILSELILSRSEFNTGRLLRIPVIVMAVVLGWWACAIGNLNPVGLNSTIVFMITLIATYSLFIFTVGESLLVMASSLMSFFYAGFTSPETQPIPVGSAAGLLFFLITSIAVSRAVFSRRLTLYLNWENISSMNSSLKWEIRKHQETLQELEDIRQDLDRQVVEKTSFLRETNKRLNEEIAERRYADKVKTALYGISGVVNQNLELPETIRKIHEQLRQIMDVTNFLVGTYDSEHQEIEPVFQDNATESFERFKLGRTLSALVIRHRRPLLAGKKGIREMVARGEVEMVGVPANSWLGVPLMVEDRVLGILVVQSYKTGVMYDQADQRMLECVSEHIALALERHQVHRTLVEAKEQAERSDRLKTAFLSNLSHEIRTPLNSILGFTELMTDSDYDDVERQKYSELVMEGGRRLLKTLTDIVELAKLQSSQMQFTIEPLQVAGILDILTPELEPLVSRFGKDHIELRYAADAKAAGLTCLADPHRLRQILVSLAENALKFTEKGFIEIGCRRFDHKQVLFWIKDTGIGMKESELERVFEVFTKGAARNDQTYQGAGLGLALSKMMVEEMNGQIWAESRPGKGSSFFFTLPLNESDPLIRKLPRRNRESDSMNNLPSASAV